MHSKRAFTLIELLVVIAIIALLLAIVTPALRKAKENARETICKTHLKNIGIAILLYLDDNDGRTYDTVANEFFWYETDGSYRDPDAWNSYWGLAYINYVDDPEIFGCPSFRNVAELIYPVDPELIHQSAFCLNSYMSDRKVSEMKSHATKIFSHDHVEPKIDNDTQDMFFNNGPGTLNLTQYRQGGSRSEFYRGIFRHNIKLPGPYETGGRANILWLDAHVSALEETTGDNVPENWYTGR